MKQTLPDYIKQNEDLRTVLLAQKGGIMKYWAEHPDADFDVDLFEGYENEIINAYLQANKQNRAVRSLPKDELRRRSIDWYQSKESELKLFVDMKPALNAIDTEVPEEVLNHIEIYLADAYKESHRCKYPEGMPPQDFYNKVVEQYNAFGLAIDCLERVLQQCRGKAVKLTVKHFFLNVIAQQGGTPEWDEVNNLQAEFDMKMFKQTFYAEGSYKKLRKAIEELIVNCTQNLAGEESRKVCREMAKEEMRKFYQFTRWVNNETYPMEKSKGGKYVPLITPEERHWLRNIMYENSPGATGKEELTTMGRYYCDFDHILQHIGTIWAAQLLVRGIDMKELEKETGIILSRLPDLMYYVDRDLNDRRGDCCVYDFKQAKMLLERIPKGNAEELNGDLASRLKMSIEELVTNINNQPEQVNCIGKIIAKSKFDWSIMVAIICGLKEDWLMDKAIQVMVDTWNEYANKKDERCYKKSDLAFTSYEPCQDGIYKVTSHATEWKYLFLKRDLEGVKEDELKRRKVDEMFNKKVASTDNLGEETPKAKTTKGSKVSKKKGLKKLIEDTKKLKPQKYYTLQYFRPDDNKKLVETKKTRVTLLYNKWRTSNIKKNDGCWGWLDARVSSNDFMRFFEGKDQNCNLILSKCNTTILTIFLRCLLSREIPKGDKKEKLIEHQTHHSAKSIICEQFGVVPNYDIKRLDNETIRRIKESIYILDFTLPLPPLKGGGDNDHDTTDDALQQYSANIDLGIDPNADVDQAVKSGMLRGGKHT